MRSPRSRASGRSSSRWRPPGRSHVRPESVVARSIPAVEASEQPLQLGLRNGLASIGDRHLREVIVRPDLHHELGTRAAMRDSVLHEIGHGAAEHGDILRLHGSGGYDGGRSEAKARLQEGGTSDACSRTGFSLEAGDRNSQIDALHLRLQDLGPTNRIPSSRTRRGKNRAPTVVREPSAHRRKSQCSSA